MRKLKIRLTSDIMDKTYRDEIVSIEYSQNITDSDLRCNPGICEQFINIELVDKNGYIRNLALNQYLEFHETKIEVTIYESTTGNTIEDEGFFIVSDWDIDMNSKNVKIIGRDPSYQFNNQEIPMKEIKDRTVYQVISDLFSYVSSKYSYSYTNEAYDFANKIHLPNSWWEAMTLYELLDKVCQLALLRIYWIKNTFMIDKVLT